MANAAERGGGTRTATPSAAYASHRAGERAAFGPAPKVAKQPRSKVLSGGGRTTRTKKPRRTSSGSNNNSVGRRISRSSSSNSSGTRRRSSTPKSPPSSTSKRITPPAPPKPVAPSNANWLRSDSTYQRQLAAYAKALADFQADQGLARGDYEQGYQSTYRDIGLAKQTASDDLENDYASRGLLKSSLYNTALGDLNQQYQNQYTDLGKQRTAFLDQLGQEFTKYKNEQGTQQQNAMQEALRRRSEKYNL